MFFKADQTVNARTRLLDSHKTSTHPPDSVGHRVAAEMRRQSRIDGKRMASARCSSAASIVSDMASSTSPGPSVEGMEKEFSRSCAVSGRTGHRQVCLVMGLNCRRERCGGWKKYGNWPGLDTGRWCEGITRRRPIRRREILGKKRSILGRDTYRW